MSSNDPAWLVVGGPCIALSGGMWDSPDRHTIVRLTATQVITHRDADTREVEYRWRRRDLYKLPRGSGFYSSRLCAPDDPQALLSFARDAVVKLRYKVDRLVAKEPVTVDELCGVLDAVDAAVRKARETVEAARVEGAK